MRARTISTLVWIAVVVLFSAVAGSSPRSATAADGPESGVVENQSPLYLPLISNRFLPPSARLCRFGVGGNQLIASYGVNALRLGWYLDWMATLDPADPGGIGYMPMIRLSQTGPDTYAYSPTSSQVLSIAAAQPGAIWLVGNEPDRIIYQDDLEPHVYAAAYHELYHLIMSADPTARIAAGGIVQPTPLRLQYLDMVLDSYLTSYGNGMPVDVWNIHAFILREEAGSWGADIPPGIDATQGELYEIDDNANIELFKEGIQRFRQWMLDRGYRDRPLIITEFGVQMPADYGFPPERVNAYMDATFDYLSTAISSTLGYYADEDRLVQQWAWYSLSDSNFNGWLFDSATTQRTVFGDNFAAYTANLPATVNFLPLALTVDAVYAEAGEVVSATLEAVVANNGSISSGAVSVGLYGGNPTNGGQLLGEATLWGIDGCADLATVRIVWNGAFSGDHTIYVVVDSQNHVAEQDETDNVLVTTISVMAEASELSSWSSPVD